MHPSPLRALARLERATVARWSRLSRWERRLLLAVILYGAAFSILTALKVYALSAFAYDLGVYNQSLYTTVANGRFFYYTADLPANPTGSIFGAHFSPILVLLLAPYALAPNIFTLTVIQSWVIALGAVPVFYLARTVLHNERLSFAFAAVFLLHPATEGVNWYDFHPEAFLLLFLPLVLYAIEARRWRLFLVSSLAAMTTIEVTPVLLLVIVAGEGAAMVWRKRAKGDPMDRDELHILILVAGIALFWLVAGVSFLLSMNPVNVFFAGGAEYWSVLGSPSLLGVYPQALLHPDRALAALTFEPVLKVWYVIVLFAPVLFLPLRSPRGLFYCLPWLGVALLSNSNGFFLVGNQYPSFVLPFVLYGAVLGLGRPGPYARQLTQRLVRPILRRIPRARAHPIRPSPSVVLVATTLVLLFLTTPMGPVAAGNYAVGGLPVLNHHDDTVDALYGFIPASAPVLTQSNLFPLLSSRLEAYVIPISTFYPPGTSFNDTMSSLLADSDYVLIDYETSPWEAALVYTWPGVSGAFSLRAAGDGAILLERGSASLASFVPYRGDFPASAVVPTDAQRVPDAGAAGGVALEYTGSSASGFWSGPFVYLPPGAYTATYRVRAASLPAGPILRLPVVSHAVAVVQSRVGSPTTGFHVKFSLEQLSGSTNLTETTLTASSIPAAGTYVTIATNFTVDRLAAIEFPGLDASPQANLAFGGLVLTQVAAYTSASATFVYSSGG